MSVETNVEPAPDTLPVAQETWGLAAVVVVLAALEVFLLLPHAPATRATRTMATAAPRMPLMWPPLMWLPLMWRVVFTTRNVRGRGGGAAASRRTAGEQLANVWSARGR